MSCDVGRRHGLDLALLWLWSRPAATAPISPLAWEPPYAAGAALEKTKRLRIKSSHHGLMELNTTSNHEVAGSIPGLTQWVKDLALL